MKRKKRSHKRLVSSPDVESVQFRLCHVCLFLNESSTAILKCKNCDHSLGLIPLDHLGEDERWDLEMAARDEFEDSPPPRMEEDDDDMFYHSKRKATHITGLAVRW